MKELSTPIYENEAQYDIVSLLNIISPKLNDLDKETLRNKFEQLLDHIDLDDAIASIVKENSMLKSLFNNNLEKRKAANETNNLGSATSFEDTHTSNTLFIHVNSSYVSVSLQELIKCEADGNYTKFFMDSGDEYLASKSLKYYEKMLKNKGFFRANRSVLINVRYIKSIYKKEAITLHNEERIVVSVRNKSSLVNFIKNYT
ncbi:LytR/AlgR family response regulator transcription factor [Tenacibaculum amylolyticum]|uniref:LytR/AlgR family response regulator transcription factor n=1 Tax=Tenacibaculum amylolyticum TaxID=104269 RepID=UPI00389311F5